MSMTSSAVRAGSKVLNHRSRFELMSDSILRFGYAADFAPFTFATDAGARGRLIETIEAALARTCFRADFTAVADGEVATRLEEGSLDAFVPAAISPTRLPHM